MVSRGWPEAAGAQVVLRVLQERPKPNPSTFLGSGKVATLAASCAETGVDVVIFDNELTPAQLRQIEEEVGRKIVDRTQLILDIFARRARTREGKLQVELAQLQIPAAAAGRRRHAALSRLGGGIGTRGPGETKLETDRRRIRTRIHVISEDIEQVRRRRAQLRERRHKASVPTVALVGYTNAGKTTLFNVLARADAETSNALFVTLDPLVRQVRLPDSRELLVSGHGRVHRSPAARARRGVPRDARRGGRRRSRAARHRRRGLGSRPPDERRAAGARGGRRDRRAARRGLQQMRSADTRRAPAAAGAGSGRAVHLGARTRRDRRLIETIASRLALDVRRVTFTFDPDDPADRERIARLYRHARVLVHEARDGRVAVVADVPRRLLVAVLTPRRGKLFPDAEACRSCPAGGGCRLRAEEDGARPGRVDAEVLDFMQPVVPALLVGGPAALSQMRGWRFLQAGDLKSAEREFSTALKTTPAFYPAETALGYVELARQDAKAALPHFDRSLERQRQDVSALLGRGRTLLALDRESDALTAFEAALAVDPRSRT